MESGFCTGRDAVFQHSLDFQVSIKPAVGRRTESTCHRRGRTRMARMDNMYASLATCWGGVGRTHCTWRAEVPRKDYFNSHRPLPSISCALSPLFRPSMSFMGSPLPPQEKLLRKA